LGQQIDPTIQSENLHNLSYNSLKQTNHRTLNTNYFSIDFQSIPRRVQKPSLYRQRREPIERNQIGHEICIKNKNSNLTQKNCQNHYPVDRPVDRLHVPKNLAPEKPTVSVSTSRWTARSTTVHMRSFTRSTTQLISSSCMLRTPLSVLLATISLTRAYRL